MSTAVAIATATAAAAARVGARSIASPLPRSALSRWPSASLQQRLSMRSFATTATAAAAAPHSGIGNFSNNKIDANTRFFHNSPRAADTTHEPLSTYSAAHLASLRDPEGFWAEAAKLVHWDRKWDKVLDRSKAPFYEWFQGAKLNVCFNAVDRHVQAGRGNTVALIHDSPVTHTVRHITYNQLLDEVTRLACVLQRLGVAAGDRVVIYMPMVPEAAFAMLACARLGAIHSVVFGGFAPHELAVRIDDIKAKVVLSASGGIEGKKVIEYKPLLDAAIKLCSHKVEKCLILQRSFAKASLTEGRDMDWQSAVAAASGSVAPVSVDANHPLYVLYTSGTTGKPKGVVRPSGGHAVALHWSMQNLYGIKQNEVWWAASDIGWVVGHSYIVYGPLINGCTSVMYEGKPVGTPDAGAFFRVISQHKVSSLFTAPTVFRAIRKEDPSGEVIKKYNLEHFETLWLAGERLDASTLRWAEEKLNVPVLDHFWQTETGSPITTNPKGYGHFPVRAGSVGKPVPGFKVKVVKEDGKPAASDELGEIIIELPLPPGCLSTLWQNDQRYLQSYLTMFPGHYRVTDAGFMEDDYLFVMTRTDDVINVAGHRLSTGQMEDLVASHPRVAECAVIGVDDAIKGQIPVGIVVLKNEAGVANENIPDAIIKLVRAEIGPVASFHNVIVVKRLPKTRSGKILRATMTKIANLQSYTPPATIDDPEILKEIEVAFHAQFKRSSAV